MFKQLLIAVCAVLVATTPLAKEKAKASPPASEANIKQAVQAALGPSAVIESIRKADALNLYEVLVDGEIIYTNAEASHIIIGHLLDTKSRVDLTQKRLDKLSEVKFSDLPLDLAIKQVKGNGGDGKRTIVTFEDPNCGYCKKLAKDLQNVTDITVYTFLYPMLAADSAEKSKAIWCAPDRAKAWNDFMVNGTEAPAAPGDCDASAITKVTAFAKKIRVRGTPAIFLLDGSRIPGYLPPDKLEQAMKEAAAKK